VDDGHLRAAPGLDVAVNGVVAGVDRGVSEPFVKQAGGVIQSMPWAACIQKPSGSAFKPA
jgi:hypothetical protein